MKRATLVLVLLFVFSAVASAQYVDAMGGRHSSLLGAIYGSMGNQLAGVMADNMALLNQTRMVGYMSRPHGYGYPIFPGAYGMGMPQGRVGKGVVGGVTGGLGGAAVGALFGGRTGAKYGLVAGAAGGALLGAMTGGEPKQEILLRNAFETCRVRVYEGARQKLILAPGTEKRLKVSGEIWAEVELRIQSGQLIWMVLETGNGITPLPDGAGYIFHNPETNPGERR